MKLICWNVNGLRACHGKGLLDFVRRESPDVFCAQETRVTPDEAADVADELLTMGLGMHSYWQTAKKKGYSGVAIWTKKKPLAVIEGLGIPEFDDEGRTLTLEFDDFFLVNAYFPNSQHELPRLPYKLAYDEAFLKHCEKLRKKKPVVFCGDLNVAHTEIDLANPKTNTMNPGFYIDEREWFTKMLSKGYLDTFRLFEKGGGHYSWWTYRGGARAKNVGWRIDYFVVSEELRDRVKRAWIMPEVTGSDHCPVGVELS